MLRRFASGCIVGSVAVAVASLAVLFLPVTATMHFTPVLFIWCIVPLIWGLWAMIAPNSWVPDRMPTWGALLGVVAGVLAAFVLDMPSRVLGEQISVGARASGVIVMVVFYFVMWVAVGSAYRSLAAGVISRPMTKSKKAAS